MGFFSRKKKQVEKTTKPKKQHKMKGRYTDTIDFTELMNKAATEPVYRADFYRRIMEEQLIILVANKDLPNGDIKIQDINKIDLVRFPDDRVPVFTKIEKIGEKGIVKGQIKYLMMKGAALFELTKGHTLVINPFSDFAKQITPEEIEKIKSGTVLFDTSRSRDISRDKEVILGQPKEYNMELLQALKIQYNDNPSVKKAYIGLVQYVESGEAPNLIIAIDADEDFDEIANDTGFTAEQYLKSNEVIEVIKLEKSSHFYGYFINAIPFYVSQYNY